MEPLTVNLTQLRKTIFANGNIDAEDVRKLREAMFSDEGMDRRKADFLFEVKDTVANQFLLARVRPVLFLQRILPRDDGQHLLSAGGRGQPRRN